MSTAYNIWQQTSCFLPLKESFCNGDHLFYHRLPTRFFWTITRQDRIMKEKEKSLQRQYLYRIFPGLFHYLQTLAMVHYLTIIMILKKYMPSKQIIHQIMGMQALFYPLKMEILPKNDLACLEVLLQVMLYLFMVKQVFRKDQMYYTRFQTIQILFNIQ